MFVLNFRPTRRRVRRSGRNDDRQIWQLHHRGRKKSQTSGSFVSFLSSSFLFLVVLFSLIDSKVAFVLYFNDRNKMFLKYRIRPQLYLGTVCVSSDNILINWFNTFTIFVMYRLISTSTLNLLKCNQKCDLNEYLIYFGKKPFWSSSSFQIGFCPCFVLQIAV